MTNLHTSTDSFGTKQPFKSFPLFERILNSLKKMRTVQVFFSLIDRGFERKNPSEDDISLIKGFLNGRERDFDSLVTRYKDMVFNLCYNIMGDYDEAVDCSQEVFIRMYKNLDRFEFRSSLSTWLYTVSVNTCRNAISSAYRKKRVSLEGFENTCGSGDERGPEMLLERNEHETAVRNAIAKLPEEERILIVMRDLEEMSYDEITEITGVKTGTVKSRISRGRHRLRGLLQEVIS